MAPPELARNTPVADVFHPLEEERLRDRPARSGCGRSRTASIAFSASGFMCTNHCVETSGSMMVLQRSHLLTLTVYGFRLHQLARLLRERRRCACGLRSGRARRMGRRRRSCGVLADDFDERQIVALPGFEVVGIVGGRDFHDAGAELRIDHGVGDDRNFAVHQRQHGRLAVQVLVAVVVRMHSERGVAEHGFGPRGRDRQAFVAVRSTGYRMCQSGLRRLREWFRGRRSRSGSAGTS